MPKKPPTLWSLALAAKQEPSSRRPVARGDSVYVSQNCRAGEFYESRLLRAHIESGEVLWERRVSHVAGAPVLGGNGVIYWACWDGRVLAFSPDGDPLWESEVTGRNMRDPILVDSSVLVACEWAGQSEHVQVLDCATGQPRWRVNLRESLGCGPTECVVARGYVVVLVGSEPPQAEGHALIGLRMEDGGLAWRESLPAGGFTPFVWKRTVHFVCQGHIQARDPETGKVVGSLEARPARNPLIKDDRAVLCLNEATGNSIAAYDHGGSPHGPALDWNQPVPEAVAATPELVGDTIAVVSEKGLVLSLDAASGELIGRFVHHRGGKDVGGLTYEDGKLFVAHGRHVSCYAMA